MDSERNEIGLTRILHVRKVSTRHSELVDQFVGFFDSVCAGSAIHFFIPPLHGNFLYVMGLILSYITHRLEADAPRSILLS